MQHTKNGKVSSYRLKRLGYTSDRLKGMSQEKRVEVIKNTNPLSNPNNKFSIRIMDKLKNETIKTVGAPNEKIAIRRAKNELSGWKRPVDEYYLSKIKDVGLTVDILLQDGGTVDFYALIQPI